MRHPLVTFWEEKGRLDGLAEQRGREHAAAIEVYPYLQAALDEFSKSGNATGCVELTDEQSNYLLNAARNMAVLAVRERDSRWLRYALLAIFAGGCKVDVRETLAHLCLLENSARRITCSLDEIFDAVKHNADKETGEVVLSFLARSPETKTLKAFGYREVQGSGGFDYKRAW
jgi:hypothetical protein